MTAGAFCKNNVVADPLADIYEFSLHRGGWHRRDSAGYQLGELLGQ
jgi:hypothetical protein